MILLLNSAVMPDEGMYTLQRISETTFQKVLRDAAAMNNFKSYIGYPETARLIEQTTGIEVDVSREQATLTPGDTMLIVKLRHRVANPVIRKPFNSQLMILNFFGAIGNLLMKGVYPNESIYISWT